jgi:hypothetical protein
MTTRRGGDLLPAMSAGFLLLVVGYVLFLGGGAILSNQPQTLGLWGILVGMIVLLGAMTFSLVRAPIPMPVAAQRTSRIRAEVPASVPEPVDEAPPTPTSEPGPEPLPELPSTPAPAPVVPVFSAEPAVRRAAALAADAPDTSTPSTSLTQPSSIPATYLQATSGIGAAAPPWSEVAPPITAALPFTAGLQRGTEPAVWDEGSEPAAPRASPSVELELSQLRARVRELEIPSKPSTLGGATPPRPTPALALAATSPQEPPAPPKSGIGTSKACVGCGTGLTMSGPAAICWGCGRTLCATCYWRYGAGPGLHRCPDCLRRSPSRSDAISGGRSLTPPPAASASGPPGPSTLRY